MSERASKKVAVVISRNQKVVILCTRELVGKGYDVVAYVPTQLVFGDLFPGSVKLYLKDKELDMIEYVHSLASTSFTSLAEIEQKASPPDMFDLLRLAIAFAIKAANVNSE